MCVCVCIENWPEKREYAKEALETQRMPVLQLETTYTDSE